MTRDNLDADLDQIAALFRTLPEEVRLEFRPAYLAALRAAAWLRDERAELASQVRRLRRQMGDAEQPV